MNLNTYSSYNRYEMNTCRAWDSNCNTPSLLFTSLILVTLIEVSRKESITGTIQN